MPLTDADRLPWLERVAAWIDGQRAKKQPGIITSEDPLTVDAGAPAAHVANEIIRLLGASATVVPGCASAIDVITRRSAPERNENCRMDAK
jgi:hypothetical protein